MDSAASIFFYCVTSQYGFASKDVLLLRAYYFNQYYWLLCLFINVVLGGLLAHLTIASYSFKQPWSCLCA